MCFIQPSSKEMDEFTIKTTGVIGTIRMAAVAGSSASVVVFTYVAHLVFTYVAHLVFTLPL